MEIEIPSQKLETSFKPNNHADSDDEDVIYASSDEEYMTRLVVGDCDRGNPDSPSPSTNQTYRRFSITGRIRQFFFFSLKKS